jgi:hypothetical protein
MQVRLPAALRSGIQRLAREYKCDVAALVVIAAEEMVAAHQAARRQKTAPRRKPHATRSEVPHAEVAPRPPAAGREAASPAPRTYQAKGCAACGNPFAPTGPNAKVCPRCRAGFAENRSSEAQLETVWDGSKGRQGASLTSH